MKIATWNVNSLKSRLPLVLEWIKKNQPDILMLQEIKGVVNFLAPEHEPNLGYHCAHSLQPTYNGVCTISLLKSEVAYNSLPNFADSQARYLEVNINGITYINVYAPKLILIQMFNVYRPRVWARPTRVLL